MYLGFLVARLGDVRNAYKILVIKHEGKISLQRLSHRWNVIIKK